MLKDHDIRDMPTGADLLDYLSQFRVITVSNLRACLADLDDTDELSVNKVGNLIVGRDGEYIAYIDIGACEGLEYFNGPEPPISKSG
jgi:hypothetical protein